MRIARYDDNRLGVVENGSIFDVSRALELLPSSGYPHPPSDQLIDNLTTLRPEIERLRRLAAPKPIESVRFLSPVANPGKIIAAPVNYTNHLLEARTDPQIHHNNAVLDIRRAGLFLKAVSSLVGPGEGVRISHPDRRNDHEIELAVIIGKPARNVSAADALDAVGGYCIGLDMTIRGPEERSLRKSLDTFTVLGPWLVTADELPDPSGLELEISVNGEVRQSANTKDLILDVGSLIAFASSFYTLLPGDVILTGTPDGVAPVRPGDVLQASISGIGTMKVAVASATAPRAA